MSKNHYNTDISVAMVTNMSNVIKKKHAVLLNLFCLLCDSIFISIIQYNALIISNERQIKKKIKH